MTGDVEKAMFYIYNSPDEKEAAQSFQVLFNPSSYSIKEQAMYSEVEAVEGAAGAGGKVQYKGQGARTLSVSLFFDTSEKTVLDGKGKKTVEQEATDVSEITNQFSDMLQVKGEIHTPPFVEFKWGSVQFRGVVDDLSTEYTMFTREGKPIRAKVNLSIRDTILKSKKSPLESPDRTKALQVTADKSIWNIAEEEYKNPAMWKIICEANQIEDPLNIPPGTVLRIPAL